jgi:arginyl-tRNA synthetase
MEQIQNLVSAAISKVAGEEITADLTRPDPQFGDFACSGALQLSKKLGQNPPPKLPMLLQLN